MIFIEKCVCEKKEYEIARQRTVIHRIKKYRRSLLEINDSFFNVIDLRCLWTFQNEIFIRLLEIWLMTVAKSSLLDLRIIKMKDVRQGFSLRYCSN